MVLSRANGICGGQKAKSHDVLAMDAGAQNYRFDDAASRANPNQAKVQASQLRNRIRE
jgi:hypothetical protein